jgi:mitochondrial fission protein ELM1
MSKNDSLIWIIADDRPGNYSQAIGLAEVLKRPYEVKKIVYNKFSVVPNFLKINGLMGIDENSKAAILNQKTPPKIIISSGRKTAMVALFLKKYYKDVFAIHIMNPNVGFAKFDLVILPRHDGISEGGNVITSIGALNRVDPDLLENEYKKFQSEIDKTKKPRIALLVGGSSKQAKFNGEVGKNLATICRKISNNMKADFLVTTSRRTEIEVIEELKKSLEDKGLFNQWQEGKPNPYFAFLKAADFIIVTGDSMSMCSEACSLGKPVYIFNPAEICSNKHLRFHQNLISENYAKKLDFSLSKLDVTTPKKLNETSRIGTKINKVLELQNL